MTMLHLRSSIFGFLVASAILVPVMVRITNEIIAETLEKASKTCALHIKKECPRVLVPTEIVEHPHAHVRSGGTKQCAPCSMCSKKKSGTNVQAQLPHAVQAAIEKQQNNETMCTAPLFDSVAAGKTLKKAVRTWLDPGQVN